MARKIRYGRLVLFLCFILALAFIVYKFICLRITNIYISGNDFFSDQDILESAGLSDYPRALFTFSNSIESNIRKSQFFLDADVHKKGLTKVYISVSENRPLFFDQISNKVVLVDGSSTSSSFNVPVLVNTVDGSIYSDFLKQISLIDRVVFNSISEIEYTPNNVDNKLFLFTMNDGNYISVNLDKFGSINKYFDMVVNFNNHKGILYLDSGEYFKILEN